MSVIIGFFENVLSNIDLIVTCFVAGGIGYFTMPILKDKIKKDGCQVSDITEAVSEGVSEYKDAMEKIESVIEDITVNDADTLNFVKDTIKAFKTFK